MAEALIKSGIKASDFKDRVVDEEKIEIDMNIEFLENWLNMLERNASDKEKHNMVVKQGFISVQHFNLYMACKNDADELRMDLDDMRFNLTSHAISIREKEIAEKEILSKRIKDESYYKNMMRIMGRKDTSPYGEDLLKRR